MQIDQITEAILRAGIDVHHALGPGLLKSAYEERLCQELELSEVSFQRQVPIPVNYKYKGLRLDAGYRLDLLVETQVVVEVKAVDALQEIHTSQLLTYLILGNWPIGFLINFNVPTLKDGIRRLINRPTRGS